MPSQYERGCEVVDQIKILLEHPSSETQDTILRHFERLREIISDLHDDAKQADTRSEFVERRSQAIADVRSAWAGLRLAHIRRHEDVQNQLNQLILRGRSLIEESLRVSDALRPKPDAMDRTLLRIALAYQIRCLNAVLPQMTAERRRLKGRLALWEERTMSGYDEAEDCSNEAEQCWTEFEELYTSSMELMEQAIESS